jgi:hypothetical protein
MTIKNGEVIDAPELVTGFARPSAQLAYFGVTTDSTNWRNADYLGADVFTAAAGAKSTVDTTSSTALWDGTTDFYGLGITDQAAGDVTSDPDSFNNAANAFDGDDSTFADKTGVTTYTLGKTFASETINAINYKVRVQNTTGTEAAGCVVKIQSYNGATWDDVYTIRSGGLAGSADLTYQGTYNSTLTTIQGLRISFTNSVSNTKHHLYTLEYAAGYDASSTVETDEIISLNSAPDSIVVYGHKDLPTGTSITVDISDDGGTIFAVTGGALNTYIDTTSLSGTSLALKFNLATTDTSVTPKLYGYGTSVCDD